MQITANDKYTAWSHISACTCSLIDTALIYVVNVFQMRRGEAQNEPQALLF